tara:strand:+ start:11559 stop:11999 length:441 start_codon:yes stop_codon:yes gene_type:complete
MKKQLSLPLLTLAIITITLASVSAAICQNSAGYYDDCDKPFLSYNSNNQNSYGNYNIANKASTPIFKGPYGNYRYTKYINGDSNPPRYFVGSGISYPKSFNGGYYGGFRGGYYGSGFSGFGYGYGNYYRSSFSYSYYPRAFSFFYY